LVLIASLLLKFILSSAIFTPKDPTLKIKSYFDELMPSLRLGWRVFSAKAGLLMNQISESFDELISRKKMIPVNLDKWNVCTVKEKEILPGNYIRYRLALPNPDSVVSLFPGQEVITDCELDMIIIL